MAAIAAIGVSVYSLKVARDAVRKNADGAAIATQLGIDGEAILGADFAALPESERLDRIDSIGVVGRVAPEHKVLLVETLEEMLSDSGAGSPSQNLHS